jgi:hypothetical protein
VFHLTVPDVDRLIQIDALRMTVEKIPDVAATGLRRQFLPGTPNFAPITFRVSIGQSTPFDAWMDNVSQGLIDSRDGQLDLLGTSLQVALPISVFNMSPISFPPFASAIQGGQVVTFRTVVLAVGRFKFQ